jgi:hypothetical protein
MIAIRQRGLHRLELTVMTHNYPALALQHKRGFDIEGTAQYGAVQRRQVY